MSGDVKHFKRRLFGGFDTTDVMLYIEELAAQRNRYKMTGDRLEAELKTLNGEIMNLTDEIKRLKNDLEDADRRILEIKVNALDEASVSIAALQATYSGIRSEMETITSNMCHELSKLNGTITSLSTVIVNTSGRFNELQTLVENEKNGAVLARDSRRSY